MGEIRDCIVSEVIAITNDNRYGAFSNPVCLGLLLALGIIDEAGKARVG